MSGKSFAQLPQVIAEIAEVAGAEAAWELARAMGGRYAYIPASAPDGHWLVDLVGREATDKICTHFTAGNSGCRLLIPSARISVQRQRLVAALEAGMTAPEAAASSGMHVRTAHRVRERKRKLKDSDQGDLF